MTSRIRALPPRLTPLQWLICAIAALGFAFDSYELLMLPLIVRPALVELLGVPPNSLAVNEWVGTLQYVPAVAGGIFGLLGGYLTDLLGRRRVLVWSILLYALLGVRRRLLDVGAVAAVLALLHVRRRLRGVRRRRRVAVGAVPDPKQRERVIGYTQAFGSIGGLMVTGAYYLIVTYGASLPAVHGGHEAWRYTLMSGRDPGDSADPHPAVPARVAGLAGEEARRHAASARASPSCSRREFRRTTIVTTVMMACAYAAAFGAIQQMPRIVPGLRRCGRCRAPRRSRPSAACSRSRSSAASPGRILLAFLAGGHRQPPPAAAPLPDSRA